MYGILIVIQVIISVLLVVVILMQASKGGGLAGIAGGMSSSAVFGGRSAANFLSRSTTILAVLFMVICLALALMSKARTTVRSVTQTEAVQPISPVPTTGSEAIPVTGGTPSAGEGAPQVTPVEGQPPPQGQTTPPPASQQPSSSP